MSTEKFMASTIEDQNDWHSETPWYWRPIDVFEHTVAEVRTRFESECSRNNFKKGDTILFSDDKGDKICYLAKGTVKIESISISGQTTIFWFCVAGDIFGAGGISGSLRQSVYAKAHESAEVLILSRKNFERIILDYPQLGINVIKFLSGRLRLACDSMAEANQRASLRVGRAILRIAESCGIWTEGREIALNVRISHQEIADMVNCTRQTVTEVLQMLGQCGLIRLEKRMIYIRDVDQLRSIVENYESSGFSALYSD